MIHTPDHVLEIANDNYIRALEIVNVSDIHALQIVNLSNIQALVSSWNCKFE